MVEWEKAACNTLRANWTMKGLKEIHEGYKIVNAERKLKGERFLIPKWYQKREPAIMNVDITKTSTKEILEAGNLQVGEATLLEGGFPCQGFSMAGKRNIKDPRNQLYKECLRVIKEALPRTFVLENVKGLTSMDGGRVIKKISEDLASCGYQLSWDVHDAADYGIPQHRERVLFIGQRNDMMKLNRDRVSLHMGAFAGHIKYPDWYLKKYKDLFKK